jgi:hypothetical protein
VKTHFSNWRPAVVESSPSSPVGVDVCPHCRRPVVRYVQTVLADGRPLTQYHCEEHRFVTPMRSAVVNHYPTDWSAA